MMSGFKGKDLFGSGPHRFTVGRRGQVTLSDLDLGGLSTDSFSLGFRELEIVVSGRLVSSDEGGLRQLVDGVIAEILDPPTAGVLVDGGGTAWQDMSLLTFEEMGPVDLGRDVSVAYEARFRRFNVLP
ncbi:MAG: hypothetical protein AAGG07_08740 [Planctomycetota bacterium]